MGDLAPIAEGVPAVEGTLDAIREYNLGNLEKLRTEHDVSIPVVIAVLEKLDWFMGVTAGAVGATPEHLEHDWEQFYGRIIDGLLSECNKRVLLDGVVE